MSIFAHFTEEHDRKVRNVQAPPGSTNAALLALPQQRVWTSDMRGGIYCLPRTGIIVAPFRMEKGGAGCIVIVGDETYPRGGHDLWVSDLELQTAVEVDIKALEAQESFYEELGASMLPAHIRQKLEEQNAALEAKLKTAGEGWDQLHFSCDNPDHSEAYKTMAPAFLPASEREESND